MAKKRCTRNGVLVKPGIGKSLFSGLLGICERLGLFPLLFSVAIVRKRWLLLMRSRAYLISLTWPSFGWRLRSHMTMYPDFNHRRWSGRVAVPSKEWRSSVRLLDYKIQLLMHSKRSEHSFSLVYFPVWWKRKLSLVYVAASFELTESPVSQAMIRRNNCFEVLKIRAVSPRQCLNRLW